MAGPYQLLAREVELIDNTLRQPAQLPVNMGWLPTQQIPDALEYKDYVLQRVEPAVGSLMGETSWGVSTGKTEYERPIISFRMHYSLSKTELEIAGRNGYDIIGANNRMMDSQLTLQIAKLVLQGADADWRVPIKGMLDVGEDVDATLDAVKWNTATSPVTHAAAGFGDLLANEYAPPYGMVLSTSLMAGMLALYNAANPLTHEQIIKNSYLQGGPITYIESVIASTGSGFTTGGYKLYPWEHASVDGVWMMYKTANQAGDNNFFLGQVTNGIETTFDRTLDENNRFILRKEWRGTPVFKGSDGTASSAPYIVYEPNVDLA